MKTIIEEKGVTITILLYLLVSIVLTLTGPIWLVNAWDHRRRTRQQNPFYQGWLVRAVVQFPALYDLMALFWNFPQGRCIYRILPEIAGSVLQIGCGTGLLNRYLSVRAGRQIDMINLDLNRRYLSQGRRKGVLQVAVNADAQLLPFKKNTFEIVLFPRCLHHIRNHRKSFFECVRVLRPGGRLIIAESLCLFSHKKKLHGQFFC